LLNFASFRWGFIAVAAIEPRFLHDRDSIVHCAADPSIVNGGAASAICSLRPRLGIRPPARRRCARAEHVVKTGKTPGLDGKEWQTLLDSIPTDTVRDLRDRALIATLAYSFARITAALKMKVEDLVPKGKRCADDT
jgi:integrase